MDKLKRILIGIVVLVLLLIVIELTIPAANGLTYGILHVFWPAIKEFYLKDWIWSIVLFIVGAFCLFGTINISRRAENKLWAVVTGIITVISFIAMFVTAS